MITSKVLESIYGQIHSGFNVGMVLENVREAHKIAERLAVEYQMEVEIKPGFWWNDEDGNDLKKGFIFSKK
jgi:hypothetical protein